MKHRRAARISAAVAGMTIAAAGLTGGAGATETRSVVATARAQGLRATYTVPDYAVISEIFDGGGPVSEAVADSTGRAMSFSSLPWPGENAVTAPGTLSVALGQSVPLVYPFYVAADHPTLPSSELGDAAGPYQLQATAADGKATALARLGGGTGPADSRATSSVVLDDDGVVRVVGESVDTGISVGEGVLRIASVRSRSETVLTPDAPAPTSTTELVIEGAMVGGQAVVIDADGVHAADQSVPAPIGAGAGSETELLRQAGITVEVVPAGPGGDALVITSRQLLPIPGNPEGTLVLRLGGAASEIVVGTPDGVALGGEAVAVPEPPAGQPASAPAASAPATSPDPGTGPTAPVPAAPVPIPTPSFTAPLAGTEANVAAPPVSEPVAAPRILPVAPSATRGLPVPDLATTGIVPSILAAGCLVLVAATRLHRLGTRRSYR
jgi:hypothetical protein